MPRPLLSRLFVTALLLAALTVPCAQAGEPVAHHVRAAAGTFSLADLLGRAWAGLLSLWPDNGCSADPDGRCRTAPALDNGCSLDPNGLCRSGS